MYLFKAYTARCHESSPRQALGTRTCVGKEQFLAAVREGLTGDKLLEFVNNGISATNLKTIPIPVPPDRERLLAAAVHSLLTDDPNA